MYQRFTETREVMTVSEVASKYPNTAFILVNLSYKDKERKIVQGELYSICDNTPDGLKQHTKDIKELTENFVFCYDGDSFDENHFSLG